MTKAKRLAPKIRFRAGRLAYLGNDRELIGLSEKLFKFDEFHFHSEVLRAVAQKDVSRVIEMGTNVTQAAAQPLAALGSRVKVKASSHESNAAVEGGLAVLRFNGLLLEPLEDRRVESNMLRLSRKGADLEMLRDSDKYLAEFAALHGIDGGPRHAAMLGSAFDLDERPAFDALSSGIHSLS